MTQDVDHPTINDDDLLWRRIADVPDMIKQLPDGTYRVSTAAFKDGVDGQVSVHLAKLTTVETALAEYPENGLVQITAGLPRSLGHSVVYDPTPEDRSHTLIVPPENQTNNSRQRDAKRLAQAALWLVHPLSVRG
jgi:hypothetical protein